MSRKFFLSILLAALAAGSLLAVACGDTEVPAANVDADELFANHFAELEPISSTSLDWPRTLTSPAGDISLAGPSQRILTLSVGHDEMVLALLEGDTTRMAGVGSATPDFSNIGMEVAGLTPVGKEVESVLALEPDIVILDRFTQLDFIQQLNAAGITTFQTVDDDVDFNIPNLLLLGYMLGQEREAVNIVEQLRTRIAAVADLAPDPPASTLIVSKFIDIWAQGDGSSGGKILDAVGAINSAAEVPANNGTITVEAIASFNPDVILLDGGGEPFAEELTTHPALATITAVENDRVHIVNGTYYSTLSHWVVCGVEQAAVTITPELSSEIEVCPPLEPLG